MKIAMRLKQKLVDRSNKANIGLDIHLAVVSLIQVMKYGDKPIPMKQVSEVFQRATRVVTSRKELAQLCKEAALALWMKR